MRVLITFTASLFFTIAFANVDTNLIYRVGVAGGVNYVIHKANFNKLANIPNCCPSFEWASQPNFFVSLAFRKDFAKDYFINFNLGFAREGAKFQVNEFIGNTAVRYTTDPTRLEIRPVYVDHILESNINAVYFSPTFAYIFYPNFWVGAGFDFSYFFTTKVNQKEQITEPSEVVFLNGSNVRNEFNDIDIPNAKRLYLRPNLSVGYDFLLSNRMQISPVFQFSYPLYNISDVSWKLLSFKLGAQVGFPIYRKRELQKFYDTIVVRDTVIVENYGIREPRVYLEQPKKYESEKIVFDDGILFRQYIYEKYVKEVPKQTELSLNLEIVGKTKDGKSQPDPTVVIEEIETEEFFPLLPYVFFKENNSNLYETDLSLIAPEQTAGFDESKLPPRTLEIYKNLLNIVGSRLRARPKAKITVVGCNNGYGSEAQSIQLSKSRAESVRDYFVVVWGIEPNRIQVRFQNLPDKPSNPNLEEGREENQRVEIYSTDSEILAPVRTSEIEKVANPPIIEITTNIESDVDLKGWQLEIIQENEALRKFTGVDPKGKLIWKVEEEPIPKLDSQIEILFVATDVVDHKESLKKNLTIQQKSIRMKRELRLGDEKIERYSLILFDFDRWELNPAQTSILKEIKKKIEPNSKVLISGFTDSIGEEQYNRELALRRCLETLKYLGIPEKQVQIQPVGEEYLLYDNSTPYGRSYCRTVQIEIRTPIK